MLVGQPTEVSWIAKREGTVEQMDKRLSMLTTL